MLTPTEQLAEAKRIQRLLAETRQSVALRLTGSLAVWYYCRDRTDILQRSNRVPRDIDFIYSAGGAAAVLQALEDAGYECDRRLALEGQGNRLRAERPPYKVDAFADPVVLRQTLHFGDRLNACSPCIPLTDLLLLKLQLRELDHRDQVDICALLSASHDASESCWQLSTKRLQTVVGHSWNWWKAVNNAFDNIEKAHDKIVLGRQQRSVLRSQISRVRVILDQGSHSLKWQLGRAADTILPDGNEVDDY